MTDLEQEKTQKVWKDLSLQDGLEGGDSESGGH